MQSVCHTASHSLHCIDGHMEVIFMLILFYRYAR